MGAEELQQSLLALLGGSAVEGLRRLSGGASRETWAFDLVTADVGEARRELILQRVRPGTAASTTGLGMEDEATLLRVAGEHGVLVAALVASDDGTHLGSPGMVVERLSGETIARKLLRDEE